MKKVIRILSLLTVLGICVSLCGCNVLDEMRESKAYMTKDGTIRLYDGSEYILLPECEELLPSFNQYMVYLTQEDVPLLLTGMFSEREFLKSDDGLFLQDYTDGFGDCYCRSDVYESIVERINSGFVGEDYCYAYYDFETEDMVYYTLTEEQAEAISTVCSAQEPEELPGMATLNYEYWADLYLCSEDMLFMCDAVDVCVAEGTYYIVDYDLDGALLYTVPDELSHVFADILEKQVESDDSWNEW